MSMSKLKIRRRRERYVPELNELNEIGVVDWKSQIRNDLQ